MRRPAGVDDRKYEQYLGRLRENQNLGAGLLSGIVAAAVGAVAWAAFTYATNYKLGLTAIIVGAFVGYAVRRFGRGVDIQFKIMGATLALLGCLAGNLLMVCAILARQEKLSLVAVISLLTPAKVVRLVQVTFDSADILFYGIAVFEGFKIAARELTQADYLKINDMP